MESDDSNDVVIVDDEETMPAPQVKAENNRPIMHLFESLISNDDHQNTVLTNAQIITILELELNIDILKLHDVEMEIYLMVIKTFLKDWPQWDEFDQVINEYKRTKCTKTLYKLLEHHYVNLKSYLACLIEKAAILSKDTVKKIENSTSNVNDSNLKDIVLEVYCTRTQLLELIFNKPHPDFNNSIFNYTTPNRSQVVISTASVESMLNFYSVKFTIDLKFFFYSRSMEQILKHVLVNEKNPYPEEKTELNTNIQIKEAKSSTDTVDIPKIYAFLDNLTKITQDDNYLRILKAITNVIKMDLDCFSVPKLKIPGAYRQCSNKYAYERKLYENVVTENEKFNLFVKETITPIHTFVLTKLGKFNSKDIPANFTWLKVECLECKTKFSGEELRTWFLEHFHLHHNNEKDWTCVNCKNVFPMYALAEKNWQHQCVIDINNA